MFITIPMPFFFSCLILVPICNLVSLTHVCVDVVLDGFKLQKEIYLMIDLVP